MNLSYTILASEIKNIKRDNSSRQMLDLRQNKLLKRVSLDLKLEDNFLKGLRKKNIKLNFNFCPIFFDFKDQKLDSFSVKVTDFSLDF